MKHRISVYHYNYLPLSETFIYRQLLGLQRDFDLNLLTHHLQNLSEYPGLSPSLIPHQNLLGRTLGLQRRFLRQQIQGSRLLHVNFGHIALDMQGHARRAGIPMTTYFLGVDASAFLRDVKYREKLRRATFHSVFVNSQDMKNRLAPHLPSGMPCHVAYCGIPLERFPFRQRRSLPDGALFLQVSRLEGKKGVDVTLRAFSRYLKEIDPTARLVVAGAGTLGESLVALSHTLGISERASFIGAIGYQKYAELLQTADVFLQPSITADDGDMEGIPTVICEAMASGLPVLATRHSGIPEAIDDGSNGFLAEERDADGLYQCMVRLRQSDIGAVSSSARTKIEERFDQNQTIGVLVQHLRRIITGDVCGN